MMPDPTHNLNYEEEQRLRAMLAAVAETDGLQAPESVERALVAGLRQRNRRRLAARIALASGIAAAVLIGLFLAQPSVPPAPYWPAAAST